MDENTIVMAKIKVQLSTFQGSFPRIFQGQKASKPKGIELRIFSSASASGNRGGNQNSGSSSYQNLDLSAQKRN